jgi:uncharacterized membrane protein
MQPSIVVSGYDATELRAEVRATSSVARHPLVIPVVAGHALVMALWSILRHAHFGSANHDLGAYDNVFWNLAHRGIPYNSVERVHQWSNHFEIGLLWLRVPYRIAPSPIWLLLFQQISCAIAALPIESIARRATGDRKVALVATVATLLTPQLLLAEIYDFHSITACAFPMALLALGVDRDSPKWIGVASVLAMSVREQMGLAVAGAALAWVLRHGFHKRGVHALGLAAVGIGGFVLEVLWVIPSFAGGGAFRYFVQYGRLGRSPRAALEFAASHPVRFVMLPFEGGRLLYLVLLACGMIPLLILSLRSPRRCAWPLVIAAPLLAVQLFNDNPLAWNIHYQYGAAVVPLLAASCALTMSDEGSAPLAWRGWLARVWLVGTLLEMSAAVLVKLYGDGRPIDPDFPDSSRAQALRSAINMIPPDATVSALDRIGPHLAHRPEIHDWPDGEKEDRFVVLESGGMRDEPEERRRVEDGVERLRNDPHFVIRFDRAGVLLAERMGSE